jgi:hypothetical protein
LGITWTQETPRLFGIKKTQRISLREEQRLNFKTWLVSYNSMGGHRALSFTGMLLLGPSAPDFGATFTEIEVYYHIDDPDAPAPTLEELLERYQERIKTMPWAKLYRRYKRIDLVLHSSLQLEKSPIGYNPKPAVLAEIPWVRTLYREIEAALGLIRQKKYKPTDDFNAAKLLAYLAQRVKELDALPDQEVLELLQELRAAEEQRVAANQARGGK